MIMTFCGVGEKHIWEIKKKLLHNFVCGNTFCKRKQLFLVLNKYAHSHSGHAFHIHFATLSSDFLLAMTLYLP